MGFLPKRHGTRMVVLGVAGLLLLGGIVGSANLGADSPQVRGGASATTAVGGVSGSSSSGSAGSSSGGQVFDEALPEVHGTSSEMFHAEPGAPVDVAISDDVAATASGGGSAGVAVIGAQSLPPSDTGRIIRSATLELKVTEKGFDAAQSEALAAVSSAGGFVQNSSLQNGRSTMTLRVPADRFDRVMGALRDIGEVRDETMTGEDVSEEFVDLDARLRHWHAQEAVFLDLMTKAESVTETIEVQQQLSTVQQNIEQIEGRKRFLENRTDLATISLTLAIPGSVAPKPEPDPGPSLSEAWDKAWDAGVEVIGGTLIVLGAAIPLSAIIGIPVAALVLARRRRGTGTPAPSPAG